MKAPLLLVALAPCCIALVCAQTAPAGSAGNSRTSELGFTYQLPSSWEELPSQNTLPAMRQKAAEGAATEDEKRGLACVDLLMSARNAAAGSMIVELGLPFDCFGHELTEKDLPGFATGASVGLKQSFDLGAPTDSQYKLGSHPFWVERAQGSPKGHPDLAYTVEITCGILKKAAVCWMTTAGNSTALEEFEQGAVALDGETATALVPKDAFKKPQ